MKAGRKNGNTSTKALAGTFRADRHADVRPIVQLTEDIPLPPAWLSIGAKEVWAADIARVVACGAREPDSHFFAAYCEMMARFVGLVKAGDAVNAAFVSELRKEMEMLGIAGAKSRLARLGGAPDNNPSTSPFSVRPA